MVVLVVLVVNVAVGRFLVGFCAFGNRTFRGFPMSGINGIWRYFVDLKFKENIQLVFSYYCSVNVNVNVKKRKRESLE